MEKRQESGPLAETLQDRESKTTRQKKKRGERKGESNDSPEIPDKVNDIRHPRPTFGGQTRQNKH